MTLAEILMVEENPDDFYLMIEVVKDSKLINRIHHVEDGLEALAFLRKEAPYANAPTPDLVLLDLNLPKKDGRQVLMEMKTEKTMRRIPVIVLTASQAEEDILKAYDHYANCFITKPADSHQLMTVMKTIEDFWFNIVKLPSHNRDVISGDSS